MLSSGFKFLFPSVPGCSTPPVVMLNVSYCAANAGVRPAVPYVARSLNSSIWGMNHHGSLAIRHVPETRPNVPQRFAEPNSELPSRRTSDSKMYRSLYSNVTPANSPIWRTSSSDELVDRVSCRVLTSEVTPLTASWLPDALCASTVRCSYR